jgi:hypothetical protein
LGWFTLADGRRKLLTWWPDTGALVLDGPGGPEHMGVYDSETDVRLLADSVKSVVELRARSMLRQSDENLRRDTDYLTSLLVRAGVTARDLERTPTSVLNLLVRRVGQPHLDAEHPVWPEVVANLDKEEYAQ